MEQAAVVDHAGDQLHLMTRGRVEHQLPGPRLEGVEDHHRPVDQLAVALEAADQVQREAVRRSGRHAQRAGEPVVANRAERFPDLRRLKAAPVGVVQQQQVEGVDATARQASLGGHADVVAVALRAAQARIGETRESAGAIALALVEVVADRTHQREVRGRDAGQRAPEQGVGLTRAVGVGRNQCVDPIARSQKRLEALVGERFAKMHEAPAAPGSHGNVTEHPTTLGSRK